MNNELKPFPCKILDIIVESELEHTFVVEADGSEINHGQFFEISIPKVGEVPISVSDHGENFLAFTIRSVGKVTNELFRKRKGDTLFLRGPYGNGWPKDVFDNENLVVISGGTGLAPVRSLIKHCLNSGKFDEKNFTLISGFKNEDGIIFREDLESWRDKCRHFYTLDRGTCEGFSEGLVTKYLDNLDYKDSTKYIIVGPPIMMKVTAEALMEKGVKASDILVSFERKMSCAVGKCGNCRIDEVYVCQEGPVFSYERAKDLID